MSAPVPMPRKDLHTLPGPGNRQVGWVVGVFLVLLVVVFDFAALRRGSIGMVSGITLGIALVLFILAAFLPAALTPVNRLWMGLAKVLHLVVSPLVLGSVFYLAVTPMAILRRKKSRESFPMGKDEKAASYWIKRTPPGPEPESLKRQF